MTELPALEYRRAASTAGCYSRDRGAFIPPRASHGRFEGSAKTHASYANNPLCIYHASGRPRLRGRAWLRPPLAETSTAGFKGCALAPLPSMGAELQPPGAPRTYTARTVAVTVAATGFRRYTLNGR